MFLLTTITPYWGRPEVLRTWVRAVKGAAIPNVCHYVLFAGEMPPDWWEVETRGFSFMPVVMELKRDQDLSIGFYHNMGAEMAPSEWIMKLDVDALPNVNYFRELVNVIKQARPREWFNGGMVFASREFSTSVLNSEKMPLASLNYAAALLRNPKPEASNFICRRQDYLDLGGCDSGFRRWGWEDYQQMYMLERHWRQGDPPFFRGLTLTNVTQTCRDFIGRPKACELYKKSKWLCLIHKWHAPNTDPLYKSYSEANKRVLLNYILKCQKT